MWRSLCDYIIFQLQISRQSQIITGARIGTYIRNKNQQMQQITTRMSANFNSFCWLKKFEIDS